MISQGAVKDIGQVCSSVFRSVAQCQRSVGSPCSVFPRVVSSVEQCGVAVSQGALGRSDAGRGLCPRPTSTLHPHSFSPTNDRLCSASVLSKVLYKASSLFTLVQRFSMREAFETRVL